MSGGGGSVSEITGAPAQMATALEAGLDVVDLNQTVVFTCYRRVVLPADGFVFWVKADILSPTALANTSALNSFSANQPQVVVTPAPIIEAQGSLHQTTVNRQNADESSSVNRLVFTSKIPVNDLNEVSSDLIYLAEVDGQRYAFSTRSMWYKQAALYHYSGDAVYPAMASQIIDDPEQLQPNSIVVSNSLPIWLSFNQLFPVYPSFLIPDNLPPPYASIHIDEEDTTPMQSGAVHDHTGSRWQLAKDVVRVTTYGVRNADIMDWMDMVDQYTLYNPDVMGVMNSPIPKDAKRGQVEISALAQKKVIVFEVNYYQARLRDLARQLIKKAFLKYFLVPDGVPVVDYSSAIGEFTIGYSPVGGYA